MRVGLVLGAGGVVGLAYHAAALAAIDQELGWDPRTAEVVVGTSAGSLVGALLRHGVAAADLAAIASGGTPPSTPPEVVAALRERHDFPPLRLWSLVGRPPRLPSVDLAAAWIRRPWRLDPLTVIAGIVPDGTLDMTGRTRALEQILGHGWPADDLWICAVRRRDLHRVVLGRDAAAPLAPAVAASCAIPGYFAPVTIGEEAYLDGGVRSPTNADVLRRAPGLDLAVVVSPMSGRGGERVGPAAMVRRAARARVMRERARLVGAGIRTLIVQPGPDVVAALGTDAMSGDRVQEIVDAALDDTRAQLHRPLARSLLGDLHPG
ncbi:MAG TPA: patatin-like phospholipase family protein [Acidimicrobiales bacterium]|nr:patatin-like phospholipase family protein [Acidimicrobiales bacterium]